jgi:hypothetical protein
MEKTRSVFASLLCLLVAQSANAQSSGAKKLAELLTDTGCGIVIESERALWRDANASDYQTTGWKAWMEQTKSATPWKAVGDFDGDGITDVAKVVIRIDDGAWMMGVEFGYKARKDCRRFQIASNSGKLDQRIVSVLTFRTDQDKLACHHVAEKSPAVCHLSAERGARKRTQDVVLMSDDVPTFTAAYEWVPHQKYKTSDGSPLMTFDNTPITVNAFGFADTTNTADAKLAQPGDTVSAGERVALVAEFDAAYNAADARGYRALTEVRSKTEGSNNATVTTMTTELQPPDKFRSLVSSDGVAQVSTVIAGGRTYFKAGSDMPWQDMGAATMPPTGQGASFGTMAIKSVKRSVEQNRKIKTVELYEKTNEATVIDVVSIDETTKLPFRRRTNVDNGTMITVTTYDFATRPDIKPPK